MEGNGCDIDHLDSDVLLPPRKRLLAGLKKQDFDVDPFAPSSAIDDITGFEFDIRLNNLLKFHSEASRVAAVEAVKLAKAARAIADEKAAKAAKAMAAAKNAMELVATLSDEFTGGDKYSKKNKMKKQVPVKMLYNTDEDLAQTLSKTVNSSPRKSKNSTSDSRNHKHKRLKSSSPLENAELQNGSTSWKGNRPTTRNGIDIAGIKKSSGPSKEKDITKFNKADRRKMENGESSQSCKADCLNMENGKEEPMNSKEKLGESPDDICNVDKKKGRIKLKKLPLRGKVNPKRT